MSEADDHLASGLGHPVLFPLMVFRSPQIRSDDEHGLSDRLLSTGGSMWESDGEVSCIGSGRGCQVRLPEAYACSEKRALAGFAVETRKNSPGDGRCSRTRARVNPLNQPHVPHPMCVL